MDEQNYQAWSNELAKLRDARLKSFQQMHRQKGHDFEPKDFVDLAMTSLDNVLNKWWSYEEKSAKSIPSGSDPTLLHTLTAELDSVVEFEMESIERDLDSLSDRISWEPKEIDKEFIHLRSFTVELKKSFVKKIHSLFGVQEPSREPSVPPPPSAPLEAESGIGFSITPSSPPTSPTTKNQRTRKASPTSSSGGGIAAFMMFLLGIILGSGPSFYFWDQSKKNETSNQEKISSLLSDKKTLQDNNAIYLNHLTDMAQGRMRTIPQIEALMRPIREEISSRRRRIMKDFSEKHESFLKKMSPGDRLDRALKKLQETRDESLANLEAEEKRRLAPYLRELEVIGQLIGAEEK